MPVLPYALDKPLPVPGFRVGSASCGVKSADLKGKRQDVTLIVADVPAQAAAVFTQNSFRAACVDLGEQTVRENATKIRAIIANAGNAASIEKSSLIPRAASVTILSSESFKNSAIAGLSIFLKATTATVLSDFDSLSLTATKGADSTSVYKFDFDLLPDESGNSTFKENIPSIHIVSNRTHYLF